MLKLALRSGALLLLLGSPTSLARAQAPPYGTSLGPRTGGITGPEFLKASNAEFTDFFGRCVAISGDTAIVGAFNEDSSAMGIDGNEADNGAPDSGAAYVFVRSGTTWTPQAYLKASNTGPGDQFGCSVAISGDTAVVGAFGEDSAATGVNGNQVDDSSPSAGAAYVFVRNGTTWTQQAYLKASNTDYMDSFGSAVAIQGDTIFVGAPFESSAATGIDGDQADNSANAAGAVYVFQRTGTTWTQQNYVKASNAGLNDEFGSSIAACGDTLVVGAPLERSKATGVNGNQSDNSRANAGAVYPFQRSGSTWIQQAYLKASNTDMGDNFGWSVAISVDSIVVGAPGEGSNATGVDGNQADNSAYAAGAAYAFRRNGGTWSQEAYLKASNTDGWDQFGCTVTIFGDTAVVGAPMECSNAIGIDGDDTNNLATQAGAAYVFDRTSSWAQSAYLKASNTVLGEEVGSSVSLDASVVFLGAQYQDGSGAAYVYTLPSIGISYCSGDPGSGAPCPCGNDNDGTVPESGCANGVFSSGARLTAEGSVSVSQDSLVLRVAHAEPLEFGLYFQGDNRVNGGDGVVFGDGLRCAGGSVVRLQVRAADAFGNSSTTIGLAAKGQVSPGDVERYQFWYRNPTSSPCTWGFNLSNGLEITWNS